MVYLFFCGLLTALPKYAMMMMAMTMMRMGMGMGMGMGMRMRMRMMAMTMAMTMTMTVVVVVVVMMMMMMPIASAAAAFPLPLSRVDLVPSYPAAARGCPPSRWVSKFVDPVVATGWHMILGAVPLIALSAALETDELLPRLAMLDGQYPPPSPMKPALSASPPYVSPPRNSSCRSRSSLRSRLDLPELEAKASVGVQV